MKGKIKRPHNLDPRVFFMNEETHRRKSRSNFLLLQVYKIKFRKYYKYPWTIRFDIYASNFENQFVCFGGSDFIEIVNVFESKKFDWEFRVCGLYSSHVAYRYASLEDAVDVANKIIDLAYSAAKFTTRRDYYKTLSECNYGYVNSDKVLGISICKEESGEYQLIGSQGLNIEILLFNNKRFSSRLTPDFYQKSRKSVDDFLSAHSRYNSKIAIQESNPNKEDGVLFINYNLGKSQFYSMEWNDFCLMIDRKRFSHSGEPLDDLAVYNTLLPETPRISGFLWEKFALIQNNNQPPNQKIVDFDQNNVNQHLFPDEIQSQNNKDNLIFKEGSVSQVFVNTYERNPKVRKKCIEYYGESCFTCGFNFSEVFGELGKGFIHVHHLKPIAEIGEEYEVDPIQDMRPVCPNCHAMIHRYEPLLSIEELRVILNKQGK